MESESPEIQIASPEVEIASAEVEIASPDVESESVDVENASPEVEIGAPKSHSNCNPHPNFTQPNPLLRRIVSVNLGHRKEWSAEVAQCSYGVGGRR